MRKVPLLAAIVAASTMFETAATARHNGSQGSRTAVTAPATCGPDGGRNASSIDIGSRKTRHK